MLKASNQTNHTYRLGRQVPVVLVDQVDICTSNDADDAVADNVAVDNTVVVAVAVVAPAVDNREEDVCR